MELFSRHVFALANEPIENLSHSNNQWNAIVRATEVLPPNLRHDHLAPQILIAAAVPALAVSLMLLQFAGVARALLLQQGAVAIVAIVAALLWVRYSTKSPASARSSWLLLGLAALICAPILSDTASTPNRWLGFSGFRLYVAPMVLPLFLLVWHSAFSGSAAMVMRAHSAAAAAALGLALQPDAAQLTAFAIAAIALLGHLIGSQFTRFVSIAVLLITVAVSWITPDSLVPVLYVEGVFTLAASYSHWMLLWALLAAALPIIALLWLAYTMRCAGMMAVAIYLAVLFLLAPVQVTPVPLLGFGAGPILGYFIMASQARRPCFRRANGGQ
jgi:hypothetical protein